MPEEVFEDSKNIIFESFERFTEEKEIADNIRKSMNKAHEDSWNCIVGKAFGAHIVHQTRRYLFCIYDDISILLWKSG